MMSLLFMRTMEVVFVIQLIVLTQYTEIEFYLIVLAYHFTDVKAMHPTLWHQYKVTSAL